MAPPVRKIGKHSNFQPTFLSYQKTGVAVTNIKLNELPCHSLIPSSMLQYTCFNVLLNVQQVSLNMCVSGEWVGGELLYPRRKVLNQLSVPMNKRPLSNKMQQIQYIRLGGPVFNGLYKICQLLEMLIASSLSAFVRSFSQIGICFISRGISLTQPRCIYSKLTLEWFCLK